MRNLHVEIQTMRRRHVAATRLGLICGDQWLDLSPDRMLIDRTLRDLIQASGLDVRRAAAQISAGGIDDIQYYFISQIGLEVADLEWLWATQKEVEAPILSMPVYVGDGVFDGETLTIPHVLPETLMTAAAGQTLGKIVETGRTDLDGRIVTGVKSSRRDYNAPIKMIFEIAPDLVEVGL